MPPSLTVRTVRRSDFDQWLPLWEGYNVFYKRVGPAAIPINVTRMTWARFFDSYDPVTNTLQVTRKRLSCTGPLPPPLLARRLLRAVLVPLCIVILWTVLWRRLFYGTLRSWRRLR